ncbi:MAG TPA: TlpA disulfide reductase family protein [Aquabacterium sp.]|nr:TlpA disulfide reductase family protein [Aquabacterium sp.]
MRPLLSRWPALLAVISASLLAGPALAASAATPAVSLHVTPQGQLDLSDWKDKVVYVDFWASWCGPCKQSFPWMIDAQNRFAKRGFVVVGVNVDKDPELAARFLKQFNPPFPIAYDPDGLLADKMKVAGMPTSMIFDRHGKVRFVHTGFRQEERSELENEINTLLK